MASDLFNVMDFVCGNLPEDWEIEITAERDAASVDLVDPTGEVIEMCDDDLDFNEMILQRVNFARLRDGLTAVDFQGNSDDGWPWPEQIKRIG